MYRKKNILLPILTFLLFASGCDKANVANSRLEEDQYGFYSRDSSVTEASIYGELDPVIYYLYDKDFFLIYPDIGSHYSPYSGGGIYYDTVVFHLDKEESSIQFETSACDPKLFEEAGVDISGYQKCEQIASTSHYTLYRMDDEIWVMEYWKNDEIVITRLKKEDHYDFVPTIRENENAWLLRDLSEPQVPDITDPDMTKEELMDFIGRTDDSRIVACLENAHVDDWYLRYYNEDSPMAQQQDDTFWYDEYRVMEYCDGELCSWLSYVFWDTPEHYEEAKKNDEWNFLRLQNDSFLMTCQIYAQDAWLDPCYRKDYEVMKYEDMLAELENNGYRILGSSHPND